MNSNLKYIILLVLIFIPTIAMNQVSEQWTNRFNGAGSGNDTAVSVKVDDSGNVYVAGTVYSALNNFDYAVMKYGSDGSLLWVQTYNGTEQGVDELHAMTIDVSGNVYVTGASENANSTIINYDFATIKYDTNGNQLWTTRYNRPVAPTSYSRDEANAIELDSSGNVYVTGTSGTDCPWGGRLYSVDYLTIKYDNAGNEVWVRSYDSPYQLDDLARAIAVDASGNVYVTGFSYGQSTYANPPDYLTLKYDSNGNLLWDIRYNGPESYSVDNASAIKVDNSGNIYVTGQSAGYGTTIKYDSNGNQLWVDRYSDQSPLKNAYFFAMALDSSANIYVTGKGTGSAPGDNTDFITIKYDTNGNRLWVRTYALWGLGKDVARAISLDSSGNVYVAGFSEDPDQNLSYATIKYNSDGDQQWISGYNSGKGWSKANAVAADASGNVYVTGGSKASGTISDFATIKYSPDGFQAWAARFNEPSEGADLMLSSDLVVDSAGNVYLTGISENEENGLGYQTFKYGPSGNMLWTTRYHGSQMASDLAKSIAVDAAGNVYVAGMRKGPIDYPYYSYYYVLVKYDMSGNRLWNATDQVYTSYLTDNYVEVHISLDNLGNIYLVGSEVVLKYDPDGHYPPGASAITSIVPHAVAVDEQNNLYITGIQKQYGSDPGYPITLKYNSQLQRVWMTQYTYPGEMNSIFVDSLYNVYVTGTKSDYPPNPNNPYADYLTIKYDSDGNKVWDVTYNGPTNEGDRAYSIAGDNAGNVYTTGASGLNWIIYDSDYATIKYDSDGNQIWVRTYDGSGHGNDYAYKIALDQFDNVYVTGSSTNADTVPHLDFTTIKYNNNGNVKWIITHSSSDCYSEYSGNGLFIDLSGNVYIAGTSYGITTNWDYLAIKYNQDSGSSPGAVPDNNYYAGVPLSIAKSGSNLILNWGIPGATCQTQNYGIYRGALPLDGYNYSSVVCTTGGSTTTTISADADSYYYLVVAQNEGYEGSYGVNSSQIQRPAASIPCLPQQIGTCN